MGRWGDREMGRQRIQNEFSFEFICPRVSVSPFPRFLLWLLCPFFYAINFFDVAAVG